MLDNILVRHIDEKFIFNKVYVKNFTGTGL